MVVYSPRFSSEERALAAEAARELMGLAIVIRFEQATQDPFDDAMGPHRCYNGAIRLYMPGYQETDRHWLHPFWQRTADSGEVKREIADRVARESVMTQDSPALEALKRHREEQLRSEREALRGRALEEAQARLEAEQSIEAYKTYFNELASEIDELRAANQTLHEIRSKIEAALGQSNDEVRQLRWRLNQRWSLEPDEPVDLTSDVQTVILLSRHAQSAYHSLDEAERDYWDKHLFSKLTEPEQRDNQSRPVRSRNSGKPCFVYPSSRTADGRRVIYYCEENEVRICEIFTSAQHDRDYDTLRDEGVDRDVYDGFADLKELLVNDTR